MVDDEFLQQFLAKAVNDAKQQIREKGTLTIENAIPLLLHSQFNHILHLEREMATKADLKNVLANVLTKDDLRYLATKDDLLALKESIKELKNWLMYGITLLAVFLPLVMWLLNR